MTSKTGISLQRAVAGLTLIELLVAASILSIGTLFVHQGLLSAASVLNHSSNVLAAERFATEAFWKLRMDLFYAEEPGELNNSGSFVENAREYRWTLSPQMVGGAKDCYGMELKLEWNEGNRPVLYTKTVYASK